MLCRAGGASAALELTVSPVGIGRAWGGGGGLARRSLELREKGFPQEVERKDSTIRKGDNLHPSLGALCVPCPMIRFILFNPALKESSQWKDRETLGPDCWV